MADNPVLADRYGRVIGIVGNDALSGPDMLLAVQGVPRRVAELDGIAVTAFPTHGEVLRLTGVVRVLLLLGTVAMLAPVSLLVALATQLSAATRSRRLAALRLAGATHSQVARLAGAESLIAGVGGAALGTALFFLVRPLATYVTYDGDRWFTGDLTPDLVGFALIIVGVPVVTALATQLTLSRVKHSPLGVARHTRSKPVRAWRILPLLLTLPLLAVALHADQASGSTSGQGPAVLLSFATLLLALLYAGPWITRCVGLWLATSSGPARLLAGRRLTDDPRTGFRAVSGVVVAILITAMFATTTPAAVESLRTTKVTGQEENVAQASLYAATTGQAAGLLDKVRQLPGVPQATLVYEGLVQDGTAPAKAWIGDCAQIVDAVRLSNVPCNTAPVIVAQNRPNLLHLADGALHIDNLESAALTPIGQPHPQGDVSTFKIDHPTIASMDPRIGVDVPDVIISSRAASSVLSKLRPTLLVFRYNTPQALERARSLTLQNSPGSHVATRETNFNDFSSDVRRLYRVLTIATLGVFGVAGLGLIVAVATGLLERRRPFALLRASGTPLRTLRRTALLESIVPLGAMSVLAAGLGALVGQWTSRSGGTATDFPWQSLLLPVGGGLLASFLVVACATGLVGPATSTEETRFS
jgi:cell division protein FtsX